MSQLAALSSALDLIPIAIPIAVSPNDSAPEHEHHHRFAPLAQPSILQIPTFVLSIFYLLVTSAVIVQIVMNLYYKFVCVSWIRALFFASHFRVCLLEFLANTSICALTSALYTLSYLISSRIYAHSSCFFILEVAQTKPWNLVSSLLILLNRFIPSSSTKHAYSEHYPVLITNSNVIYRVQFLKLEF